MTETAPGRSPLPSPVHLAERLKNILTIAAFTAATIAWVLFCGKDLNFDQLNYHFYLPFNLLEGRLERDFVAANGQAYLNPFAYVPFYWMVMAEWPTKVVGAVLAAAHSLNIALVYYLALTCFRDCDRARMLAILSAALAFVSPIYLMEAGTSFADITTASLVLAALLALVRARDRISRWQIRTVIAGVCFGAACGLKLSNLVFAPALGVALIVLSEKPRAFLTSAAALAVGGVLGLLVTHGYWSWLLWNEFGNPFFPLFNSVFGSMDYPQSGGGVHERFLPHSLLDVLTLPFRLVTLRAWVHIESVAPDLRFAAMIIVGAVALALALKHVRRGRGERSRLVWLRSPRVAVVVFFLVATACWLWTSGNGRYGIVVSLLAAPVLVITARCAFGSNPATIAVPACVAVLQVFHLTNAQLRWDDHEWTRTWYEVNIPAKLRTEPYLYIAVGGNSNSFVFPYLASGSAFTNPIGYVSFELDGPGGARLKRLMSEYEGRVRLMALHAKPPDLDETGAQKQWLLSMDSMVARLGYAVDPSDCLLITTSGQSNQNGHDYDSGDARRIQTCALKPQEFTRAEERKRMINIARDIASWCPKLFQPSQVGVERSPNSWYANFNGTDIILVIQDAGPMLVTQPRSTSDIYLGTVESWEAGTRPSCESLPRRPRDVYTFE